jgi:hypothetical protein
MANSSRLLDTFTQLLAYMGDEGAQDGYNNINIRDESISPAERNRMVKKMVNVIEGNARLSGMPKDITAKVNALKELADNPIYSGQRQELLDYMREYNADDTMRGGSRRRKTQRKTRRRRNKTNRNAKYRR